MAVILALSGKKGSGKDTFFLSIENVCPWPVVRLAFADPLKEEIYKYVLKPNHISKDVLETEKSKYRQLFQWWGTEFRRSTDDCYWINLLDHKLSEYINKDVVIVITDLRFLAEVKYLQELDAILVEIRRNRPTLLNKILQKYFSKDKHSSENELNDFKFHYTIVNNQTVEELDNRASLLLKDLNII